MKTVAWPRALVLALAVGLCYANSLRVPFLLDDPDQWTELDYSTRPLVWASFDLNRLLGRSDTTGFHVFNALVHLGCGLLLYGVLRRSMAHAAPALAERTRTELAFVTSLLWLVHPLQTASITYLSQRAEAMASLFYLGVLYAFLRAATAARPRPWQGLALLSLALGFATKEIIATAPLLVWLFDALLLSLGPLAALRARRGFYAALALVTLGLVLAFVAPVLTAEHATAGFRFEGFGPLEYARTEAGVVLHYLRLALWPHPLCFDYGWPIATEPGDWLPQAALLGLLLLASALLLARRSWIGLAGASFFAVLAPTSSFVPILDAAAEHRMYLVLAAVLVLVVVGAWRFLARFAGGVPRLRPIVAGAAALGLAAATVARNRDYATAVRLWEVTVARAPHNARAHDNLGAMLLEAGRAEEAIPELTQALNLAPEAGYNPGVNYLNLGIAYTILGQPERAVPFLERAERWMPGDPRCPHALGKAHAARGDPAAALPCLWRALTLRNDSAELHFNLGESLRALGDYDEALAAFYSSSSLAPDFPAPYAAYAETVCVDPDATPDERREAARRARIADEMTGSTRPEYLAIRARAEAALGEFPEAVRLVELALELPGPAGDPTLAEALRAQRADYLRRAGQ